MKPVIYFLRDLRVGAERYSLSFGAMVLLFLVAFGAWLSIRPIETLGVVGFVIGSFFGHLAYRYYKVG